ncbi:hypothetical protein BCR39DRAFT_537850 [Naematelia encephala]|uniref:Uncharacterized protein n=1 Tax=Naematelia encephala TaxID=71784 RepID=A0A1Y2AYN2_9TREE|nr:hypothetical protein BCR39DRAFT_537850 [Naematelia encephala]
MTSAAHSVPDSSRPFSPSPPRENRHTASRPPSLCLGASSPFPLVASSSSFSFAGLPDTPSPPGATIDGLPRRRNEIDSLFTYGDSAGAQSLGLSHFHEVLDDADESSPSRNGGLYRRDSDSSTSSTSPALGAASLLQTLIESQPARGQTSVAAADSVGANVKPPSPDASPFGSIRSMRSLGDDVVQTNTLRSIPGSPGSHQSQDSSLSTSARSLPRIHQPTVVRSSSGRGLAFLPPPAQVSPTSSSFTIHQIRPKRSSMPRTSQGQSSQEEREETWRSRSRSMREGKKTRGDFDRSAVSDPGFAKLPLQLMPSASIPTVIEQQASVASNKGSVDVTPPSPTTGPGSGPSTAAMLDVVSRPEASAKDLSDDGSDVSREAKVDIPPERAYSSESNLKDDSRPLLGRALSLRSSSYRAPDAILRREQTDLSDEEVILNEISDAESGAMILSDSNSQEQTAPKCSVYVPPYKPRSHAATESASGPLSIAENSPLVVTIMASIGSSRSAIPFSSTRLEVDLTWTHSPTFQWIPGRRYIPAFHIKYMSGGPAAVAHKPTELVLFCRDLARELVGRVPVLGRLKNWI